MSVVSLGRFELDRKQLIQLALFATILVLMMLIPEVALAADEPAAPWEGGVCRFTKAVTGPWVGWVAVIAVVIAAVLYGVGESNQNFQTAMRIVAGFSIALGAVAAAGWFFPGQIRALTC